MQIETQLARLSSMSKDELVRRCAISRRGDYQYVPDECLRYLVRASRAENADTHFDRLCKILGERVLRRLPRAESRNAKSTSLKLAKIGEKMFDQFVERLAEDRMRRG